MCWIVPEREWTFSDQVLARRWKAWRESPITRAMSATVFGSSMSRETLPRILARFMGRSSDNAWIEAHPRPGLIGLVCTSRDDRWLDVVLGSEREAEETLQGFRKPRPVARRQTPGKIYR